MNNLINGVSTILSFFFQWFTTITEFLIQNPFVILMFGLGICLLIVKLVIRLVSSIFSGSSNSSYSNSTTTESSSVDDLCVSVDELEDIWGVSIDTNYVASHDDWIEEPYDDDDSYDTRHFY